MKVRKAVIPAAGWGTRFLPATKAVPKEMLPIIDKPVIQRVVEEAVEAGIEQVIIITAGGKRVLEDHFDRARDLEQVLEKKGDGRRLAEIERISRLADIVFVRQKDQLGLGHAVLTAKRLVGDEPFAVLLPDDLIDSEVPAIRQLTDVYDEQKAGVVAVLPVKREEIPSYGIISPKSLTRRVYEILDLVEKPAVKQAPSNLGIVGRYVLPPEVFEALENTGQGRGGEIQLTDGLRLLLQQQKLFACELRGIRYDVGTPLGFIEASVEFGLNDPVIGPELRAYLVEALGLVEVRNERPSATVVHGEQDGEPWPDVQP